MKHKIGIFNEFLNNHSSIIKACKDLNVNYEMIDLISTNWIDNIIKTNCNAFIYRPSNLLTHWKNMFEEKVYYVENALEKIRHYPHKDSSGSFFRISENKFNINYDSIRTFFSKIKYEGLFDIEFKFSDKKCYFIEVNFRNGGTNYLYTKSGANIPYLWYLDSIGRVMPKHRQAKIGNICMYEERDWRNVLIKNISLKKGVLDLFRVNVFTTFNIKDIKPFIARFVNNLILHRK
ncbi:hypothetical protein H8D59_00180 [bacterium]|nr:hypothetical protein [bacterium]